MGVTSRYVIVFLMYILLAGTGVNAQSLVFYDPLDGSSVGNDSAGIVFESGYSGQCANMTGDDSFVRYSGSILPGTKGTIDFYWKPPENIYQLYSYRHEGWTDYYSYKPPSGGFLLDNIGWRAAPTGAFSLTLSPISWQDPDSPASWIRWQIWDGIRWNVANNIHSSRPELYAEVQDGVIKLRWNSSRPIWIWDPNVWYRITVTWGPNGMHLYVNGEEWSNNSYTGAISTSKSFSLGQDPGYWPYGPHTMRGCYDELRIYDYQMVPTPSNPDISEPSGYVLYYGTESGNYMNSVEVGGTDNYELNLPPGTYYIAVAAKTKTGFIGPLSNEAVVTVGETAPTSTFQDDFSTDSGMWEYIGDAYRDAANGYIVLTRNVNSETGVVWLKQNITSPFTAEFRYKSGGGTGGDGLVFMFYKDRNYSPDGGGYLGFTDTSGTSVPGYGIEFDNHYYYNSWDPREPHIALIKDNVNNHLIYVGDTRTGDNSWHNVKVEVGETTVKVYLDGSLILTWSGQINRDYGGIGFGAGTGIQNNWHIIDDVRITVTSAQETETVPDNVDDTKEQIISKYNPAFDWKTQTPTKQDVLNAVINAVIAYFSTQDDAAKQEIVSDVVQMVILYFSLGS